MKQSLKIGNAVDDGSGDYLRNGGLKINNNFDDLYFQLGDGTNPHAAGAWKTHDVSVDGGSFNAVMGRSYTVNTSGGRCSIQLPKGTSVEYNFVIRLRDVFSTWQVNPVSISPAIGDTIKGSPNSVEITRNLADLELVYCAPGRWEYIDNKQVDRISNNDIATVAKKAFIATEGQTDFVDMFDGVDYNIANLQVFHRGNLLTYSVDDVFDVNTAEFGSIGSAPGEIVALDGKTIRLKIPCVEGDTVVIQTFMDGLGQWRSSYNRRQLRMLDAAYTDKTSIAGSLFVGDLKTKKTITIEELGISTSTPINPNACEVYLNSTLLYQAGTAGLPEYKCTIDGYEDSESCTIGGGDWVESFTDYLFNTDDSNRVESISFDLEFEDSDILAVVWYNNDIGTTMTIDEILDETNTIYVSQGSPLEITGNVRITDEVKPFAPNVEPVPPSFIVPGSVSSIFDLVYPVGTIYENTVNPNNPATYMGFGVWQRLENTVLVGWSSEQGTRFNLNNNDLDSVGNMNSTAGGTGGSTQTHISESQVPKLKTDDKVLIEDPNGPIVVGGCMVDPDASGPAYTKYREDQATINKLFDPVGQPVDTMPPYLVVHRWMRIS